MLLVLVAVVGLSVSGCSKKEPTVGDVVKQAEKDADKAAEEAAPVAEEAVKDAEKAVGDLQK
ncbi:MAG: hypothetical protein B6I25_06545 [Planctomycetales bacterium 4572_13]|nr:MAG: hypothetical protein B6I25_06545 [Planctomycetales bacterium 4572_13]